MTTMIKSTIRVLASTAIILLLSTSIAAHAGFPDDFSDVTWIDPDISSFPVTSTISANVNGSTLAIQDTKRSVWPARFHTVLGNNCCNRSLWIFIKRNGRWYATTFEFMRFGQINKAAEAVNGGQIKRPPFLDSNFVWHPAEGEVYGFMTSGMSRFDLNNLNVRERSNISLYRWGVGPTDNIDFNEVPRDANGNPTQNPDPEAEPEACVEPAPPAAINNTHIYNGTANGTLIVGTTSNDYSAPVSISIKDDRSVTFTIGGESVTTEVLPNNTYSGSVVADFSLCTAVINYSGSVDGNISSGTATSNACGTTPVTFNASFSASSNTSPSFIDQRDPVRQDRTCPLNAGQLITPIFTLLLTN